MVDGRLSAVFAPEMVVEFKPQIFLPARVSLAAFGSVHTIVVLMVTVLACFVEVLRPGFEIVAWVLHARAQLPLELVVERCALRVVDVVGVGVYLPIL